MVCNLLSFIDYDDVSTESQRPSFTFVDIDMIEFRRVETCPAADICHVRISSIVYPKYHIAPIEAVSRVNITKISPFLRTIVLKT